MTLKTNNHRRRNSWSFHRDATPDELVSVQKYLNCTTNQEYYAKIMKHYKFMQEALKEALKSENEGGIPIGAVLVKNDHIVGRGHNQIRQKGSTILHAEMDCLENAGHLNGSDYKKCTLYTTLLPCDMCTGLVLLYKIPLVVVGENETFPGPEDYLKQQGVELINLDLDECKKLLTDYIRRNREVWDEELERVN